MFSPERREVYGKVINMKHRIATSKLSRDTNNRKALFKSLISSLIQVGEIKTTEAKAKAIKGLTDKLIRKAQDGSITARRLLARFFGRRDIVNKLVDNIAPTMKDRTSGFTRIIPLGKRRGDNATLVKMELIAKPVEAEVVNKDKDTSNKKQETKSKKN